MKALNRATGLTAENLALDYLIAKDYQLIARNFSTRFGEIDLVMQDRDITVFVEVKAKKDLSFGPPEDMFTKSKYHKVKNMATLFLNGKSISCRIDLIAIVLDNSNRLLSLHHYPNVIL
jgi:putative endonuclease